MIDFLKARRIKKVETSASGGAGGLMGNKAAIAVVVILLLAAAFVLLQSSGQGPAQGTTTTTAPLVIKSTGEAGNVISDLSSSAVDVGSLLKDIDNSIG